MTAATATLGAQPRAVPPWAAQPRAITPAKSHKIVDLLAAIASNNPDTNVAMLQVTAKHIAEFKGVTLEQLAVEALASLGADFKLGLKARGYKPATVRTYLHFANFLAAQATQLGVLRPNLDLSTAWAPVMDALGKKKSAAATIIAYAIGVNRRPEDFLIEDLRHWVQLMQRQGRTYNYVVNQRSRFARAMARCGFLQDFCEVISWRAPYTVPLEQLPPGLQAEIQALAAWKQAKFAPGRRRGCRHRAVSASKLVRFITQIHGYATTVQRAAPSNLLELITKERVQAFVGWFINERQRKAGPTRANLGLLAAAVKQYPPLASHDFAWLGELILSIEEDEGEQQQRRRRKERSVIPYGELAAIPDKIRAERERGGHSAAETALLVMYEFLLRFWVALPWRQRNIRELRLLGDCPNLFKAELPPRDKQRNVEWIKTALEADPTEQFWQFRFSEAETKTGNTLNSIVPLSIVPALELYLQHRPTLLKDSDPGTLFVNNGEPYADKRMTMLIGNLTFKYAGRATHPHRIRDSYAYHWLANNPGDYLTLSKILWHRRIDTTIRIYGSGFDETDGVIRADEMLNARKE